MRRHALLGLLLLLSAATLAFSAETGEQLIRRIYKDHQPNSGKNILNTRESMSQYLDSELIALILKDYECSKTTGEVCNLDYDPILNAQDISDEDRKLQVKKTAGTKDSETYSVTFQNFEPVTLIYQLRKTGKGWRVDDIVDEEGGSLKKLLSQPHE